LEIIGSEVFLDEPVNADGCAFSADYKGPAMYIMGLAALNMHQQ
jgi:hypothetical protein